MSHSELLNSVGATIVPGITLGSQSQYSENVCSPYLPELLKIAKKKCISKGILNLDGLRIYSVFII